MGFYIREAKTPEALDALFCIRHTIFVEQARVMAARRRGRIYDRFDAFPDTINLIAWQQGTAVGGLRLVPAGPVGIPADQHFDFWPHLPEDARVGSASMFCMDQALDQRAGLTRALVGMFYLRALQRGLTHIVAPINPEMESTVVEFGYEAVGPVHTTPDGLVIRPMVLQLQHLKSVKEVMALVQQQRLTPFLDTFDRAFFSRGERIITADAPAHEAYVLLSGSVTVRRPNAPTRSVQTLRPGALLGELALLANRTRTADVVAEEDCDLMVMSRKEFLRRLQQQPALMSGVLELVAERLADTMSTL